MREGEKREEEGEEGKETRRKRDREGWGKGNM